MKGKDLAVIGGIGLAVYLLIPKAKVAEPIGGNGGGITTIIPELNIPEFKFPDVNITEIFQYPTTEKDLESIISPRDELVEWWDRFISLLDRNGKDEGDKNIVEKVIDVVTGGNGGNGGREKSIWEKLLAGEPLIDTDKITTSLADTAMDLISAPFDIGKKMFDEQGLFSEDWWTEQMPEWALTEQGKAQRAYGAESEAIFELAGVTQATPGNLYKLIAARNIITGKKEVAVERRPLLSQLIGFQEAESGVSSESPTIDEPFVYEGSELQAQDIALLKKHPYFSTLL